MHQTERKKIIYSLKTRSILSQVFVNTLQAQIKLMRQGRKKKAKEKAGKRKTEREKKIERNKKHMAKGITM